LQWLVLLERKRISAKDAEGRARSEVAGHVRYSESEKTGSATNHGANRNDPPRSVDPGQQTVRARAPRFGLAVIHAQH
jgi:hypothetical protein